MYRMRMGNSFYNSPISWQNFIVHLESTEMFPTKFYKSRTQTIREELAKLGIVWDDDSNDLLFKSKEDFLMFTIRFSS